MIDFPEASTFLKRATLLLEDPALLRARDSRLWKGFTASLKGEIKINKISFKSTDWNDIRVLE